MTSIIGFMASRKLLAELKQKKDFSSPQEEAFLSVLRTADNLSGRNAGMLKEFDLSPTQYNALRILRGAGSAGLACSEIGQRMIRRDPDITRLMDRLEKRGLVGRRRLKNDMRVVRARITSDGLKKLRESDAPVIAFVRKLLGHMTEPRLRMLTRLLDEARG